MKTSRHFNLLLMFLLLITTVTAVAKPIATSELVHKWRVIWYSDDGVQKNMEAKKQQLHLRADGTGTMFMLGEVVGPVTWSVWDKKSILFSDEPGLEPYPVKVKLDKDQKHMTFSATMPNGVKRVVYFEVLSGRP